MSNKPNLENYVDVAERIAAFKKAYPEGTLQSEVINLTDNRVVVKAYAYRTADDARPAIGHAQEQIPGATPYTRGSELMVCETSAWGRAIAALGFEVRRGTPIATRQEVEAAEGRRAQTQSDDEKLRDVAEQVFGATKTETVVLPAPSAPVAPEGTDASGVCPKHKTPWVRKQGVAKASGKPYDFYACDAPKDEDGFCRARPSIGWVNLQELPF